MLYNIVMARGDSGRIVLEIDPSEKEQLYDALEIQGLTLKDWFLQQAARYLQERAQPSLFGAVAESPATYGKAKGQRHVKGKTPTSRRERA